VAKRKKGFTLRVTFHGIMRPVKINNRVVMLLCKLDRKTAECGRSYVLFEGRNYPKKLDQKNRNRKFDETKKSQHAVFLDQEFLSIDANVAPHHRKLSMNRLKDKFSDAPTAYDEFSLRWLADLNKLNPGCGTIKEEYLQAPPAAVTPPLIARIDLTQGYLHTNGVEKVLVPFRTNAGDEKLVPIARELVLELDIKGDGFTLQSDPLAGPDSPRSTAKDMHFLANGDDVVEIAIGNEAYDGIYEDAPPILPIDVLTKKAAKEYEFYYSMSTKTPEDPYLPYVASRQPGTSFCDVPHP
jgi:hypothetical protein